MSDGRSWSVTQHEAGLFSGTFVDGGIESIAIGVCIVGFDGAGVTALQRVDVDLVRSLRGSQVLQGNARLENGLQSRSGSTTPPLQRSRSGESLAPNSDLCPERPAPGARVILDGQPVGVTPMSVSFSRHCEGLLRLELDGYQPLTMDVDKVLNGWLFGNIFFGGLIGIAVDLLTGNAGKYSTAPINVNLARAGQP